MGLSWVPLLASTVLPSSCSRSCQDYAAAALTVGVTEASGAPICDAEVVATDGSDEFVLEPSGCSYAGAYERPGTYVVRVSYRSRSIVSETISVPSGACHVKSQRVDLTLPA